IPRLADWNRHAIAGGLPWLQVLPFDGRFAAIGPLFVPGETCCYECYRLRRSANVFCEPEYAALDGTPARYPLSPALLAALAGLGTHLAFTWIVQGDPQAVGIMFAFEWTRGPTVTGHHVYRVPRCPACSAALDSPPAVWFDAERSEVGV
ncbi:MAG TPA: TOMM precursor leader peptide-binding protein, partial [Gaiellaceae bacterium]|nr:TOMM precursor leader peptide-binding protein [Gaiellaceae bacterium]